MCGYALIKFSVQQWPVVLDSTMVLPWHHSTMVSVLWTVEFTMHLVPQIPQ